MLEYERGDGWADLGPLYEWDSVQYIDFCNTDQFPIQICSFSNSELVDDIYVEVRIFRGKRTTSDTHNLNSVYICRVKLLTQRDKILNIGPPHLQDKATNSLYKR